ncbi:MAG: AAA family ATPase [Firmicutes bacterium]|nr:AAA family ATPase [Bacillota bacterium]
MDNKKLLDIISEINDEIAERKELIECMVLALLSSKNLFILGDTGQGKSYAINAFRKRIEGAKQFERLISKQTDEEQLFGRIDLTSLIPNSLPKRVLLKDTSYAVLNKRLEEKLKEYEISGDVETLKKANSVRCELDAVKEILCALTPNAPEMITTGKIPDSHIVFIDEVFKANDGILNSLLTALNERVYTNEGQTVKIPVISFFAASNEIPDFNDSAQSILKPLYDRFDFKVLTQYIADKDNRIKILKDKQKRANVKTVTTITLDEMYSMQREIRTIIIPDKINELIDTVLCELRRRKIHVSDRKFFGFTEIVQAKAFLEGRNEVIPKDLLVLKNYFWNKPDEIQTVENVLRDICENPIGAETEKYLNAANEIMQELESEFTDKENLKPYVKFSKELLRIYSMLVNMQKPEMSAEDIKTIKEGAEQLEELNKKAAELANVKCVSLEEKKRLDV